MRVLETERLLLRWFDEKDAAFVLELVNEPSWIANIGDRHVRTLDQARAWIRDKLVGSYWRHGHGLWAVERRSDGELLGMCGLVQRDSLAAADVGYAFVPRFWGQGHAREAAAASLRYAFDVLGRRRVLAIVTPDNERSIHVLEAIGMRRAGVHRAEGGDKELALFAAGDEPGANDLRDDRAEIDALARRFFSAFCNRGVVPRVASLPSMFLPGAAITVVRPGGKAETSGVEDFVTPRAALLFGGRLRDFEEHEVEARTEVQGSLAWRASRYRKAGELDGEPCEGGGWKLISLVRTDSGWKIAALVWEDVQDG
ncbi:MAG TPA: GNAT family N-acetyltransferase [Polyangiaceae bacterium]